MKLEVKTCSLDLPPALAAMIATFGTLTKYSVSFTGNSATVTLSYSADKQPRQVKIATAAAQGSAANPCTAPSPPPVQELYPPPRPGSPKAPAPHTPTQTSVGGGVDQVPRPRRKKCKATLVRASERILHTMNILKTSNVKNLPYKPVGMEWKRFERHAGQFNFTFVTQHFRKTCVLTTRNNGLHHQALIRPEMDYCIVHAILKKLLAAVYENVIIKRGYMFDSLPNFKRKPDLR